MASARQAALAERRSTVDYGNSPSLYGGGVIRILAPRNTGISSIAKQNAASEASIMIARYDSGQISNEEMKAFFQTQLNNPYVSTSDKTQIQSKLLDFDALIEKDRLESVFKQAPENSLQKIQAATALADFYTRRASTMVAGTPAHSQALENAGNWQQSVQDIQASANKEQLINLQNKLLQDVNRYPTGSQKSYKKADMYNQLYNLALKNGDQDTANKYAALYEQEMTYAEQYEQQEAEKKDIADIKKFASEADLEISQLKNNSPEELAAKAKKAYEVAERYAAIGDEINYNKYMAIYNDSVEKYEKKSASMTTSATATNWDKNDDEYKKEVQKYKKQLSQGIINVQQYSAAIASIMNVRKQDLDARISYAETLDDNAKLKRDGKNIRAEDLLNLYYTERDQSSGLGLGDKSVDGGLVQKMNDYASGEMVAVMVPPNEVTKAGNISLTGSGVARIEFVNKNNLLDANGQLTGWAIDDTGTLHKISRAETLLTPEQAATITGGVYTDPLTGESKYTHTDSSGNVYAYEKNKKVVTYRPETAERFEQGYTENQPISSFNTMRDKKYEETMDESPTREIEVPDLTMGQKPQIETPKAPYQKPPLQVAAEVIGPRIQPRVEATKTAIQQNVVEPIRENVVEPITKVAQPIVQKAQKVIEPIKQVAATPTGQYKPSVAIQQAVQPTLQKVQQAVSTPTGQFAPTTNLFTTGLSNIAQAGQAVAKAAQPVVQKVQTGLQNLGTKIKSGWNWFTGESVK